MDFKVLIAESALADLQEIVEFVAQDNSLAAKRLGEKLVMSALSLSTMPFRNPYFDRKRGIRKMTIAPYLIYYICDEEASSFIQVIHIWHGARRPPGF